MSLRVAIYARYSSDNQRDASIDDQIRLCRQRIATEGWELEQVYRDAAISGASTQRPGYQAMLEAAREGGFDIILAEALDRLSRDQEDIAGLYKRLKFAGISLFTLTEGEISELHIGLKGTMNALFLKDLAAKTHRGLMGRIAAGKSAGGLSYGYKIALTIVGRGIVERGDRRIDETEANIVRRIFRDFADGLSPIAIAKQLNVEHVPGPEGRPWQDTTLRGHAERATGILRNELYIGRLVWNRMRYLKNPSTGKRVSRMNPRDQWVVEEVPQWRVIDEELWNRVQYRLNGIRERAATNSPERVKFWENRRAQHLLTGKVFCRACGGQLSAIGRDYLACNAARKRGICTNNSSLRRSKLETMVIEALRASVMNPDDIQDFISTFTAEWNRLAAEINAERAQDKTRLATIERKIAKIIEAVMDGFRAEELKQQLETLSREKARLQAKLDAPSVSAPLIHPNLAQLYRSKVAALQNEFTNSGGNNAGVLTALRDLIERVDFGPGEEGGEAEIILTGILSSMVRLGLGEAPTKTTPSVGVSEGVPDLFTSSVKLVAGPCNNRELVLVCLC
ncbi:MAG: recombinase family protein [Rhodospirillales bacterium]|nr:recombinase family protein [Rhodospirillales bacterium]